MASHIHDEIFDPFLPQKNISTNKSAYFEKKICKTKIRVRLWSIWSLLAERELLRGPGDVG